MPIVLQSAKKITLDNNRPGEQVGQEKYRLPSLPTGLADGLEIEGPLPRGGKARAGSPQKLGLPLPRILPSLSTAIRRYSTF